MDAGQSSLVHQPVFHPDPLGDPAGRRKARSLDGGWICRERGCTGNDASWWNDRCGRAAVDPVDSVSEIAGRLHVQRSGAFTISAELPLVARDDHGGFRSGRPLCPESLFEHSSTALRRLHGRADDIRGAGLPACRIIIIASSLAEGSCLFT